jgi:hypothetical protein
MRTFTTCYFERENSTKKTLVCRDVTLHDQRNARFVWQFRLHPDLEKMRPERIPAPTCMNCPLLSVVDIPIQELMNDCKSVGWAYLKFYEERGDYEG